MKRILASLCGSVLTAGLLLSVSGCSQEVACPAAVSAETIQNFTYNGDPVTISVAQDVPRRVVVCGNSAIDTVIALGAGDAVLAAVLTENGEPAAYQKQLPHAEIGTQPFSQEYLLTQRPDCLIGWRRFFEPKQMGDTEFWKKQGVTAYIQDASGPIPSLGNFPPCTVESEIQFLRNMGKLFHQESKAGQMIETIQKELDRSMERTGTRPKVLTIELMGNNIEVFGANLLSGDIVKKLGGDIIDFGYPFISKEELLIQNADVVFVVYHGTKADGEAQAAYFRELPLQEMRAIREGRVYPLPYEDIVAPAVHTAETIRYIRQGMYGEGGAPSV